MKVNGSAQAIHQILILNQEMASQLEVQAHQGVQAKVSHTFKLSDSEDEAVFTQYAWKLQAAKHAAALEGPRLAQVDKQLRLELRAAGTVANGRSDANALLF